MKIAPTLVSSTQECLLFFLVLKNVIMVLLQLHCSSSIFSDIRSEIEAIADAADHDGYASGIQALEQESSSSSSRGFSIKIPQNFGIFLYSLPFQIHLGLRHQTIQKTLKQFTKALQMNSSSFLIKKALIMSYLHRQRRPLIKIHHLSLFISRRMSIQKIFRLQRNHRIMPISELKKSTSRTEAMMIVN